MVIASPRGESITKRADQIFLGGTALTVDAQMHTVGAVAVKDGRILAIGSEADVRKFADIDTELVDLAGATLLPGFVEPHSHPVLSSITRSDPIVDIRPVTAPNFDAMMALVRRRVAKAKPGEFLVFHGYDPLQQTGATAPTLAMLDDIAPMNPVAIRAFAGSNTYVNSCALRVLEITDDTRDPLGHIVKDEKGEPTGKLLQTAAYRVQQHVNRTPPQAREHLEDWIGRHARAGYTASTEMRVTEDLWQALEAYRQTPNPSLRLVAYLSCAQAGNGFLPRGYGDDVVHVEGIKLFTDGSPFTGNIWMSKPYLNTEVTISSMGLPRNHIGEPYQPPDQLAREIDAWAAAGYQLAVHAQGDRSIDSLLDAYEATIRKYALKDHRFRIEHCALPRQDQLERCAQLGVTISFFLPHLWHRGEILRDSLFGEERMAHYMPIGSAYRAGVPHVSVHADAPAADPDAIVCLTLAANRRSKAGALFGDDERLPVDEAIRSVTINAAWQMFMDNRIGSIEPGKHADFVLLDKHPQRVPREELRALKVLGTWVDGRAVWRA